MNRKVAAVIVTYNRLETLKATLAHALAEPFHTLVVVDNCCTDGTGAWLDVLDDPRLHIIHSPENGGGAGGFHLGFDYVATRLPEAGWLVAFDDDAWPQPGTLEQFEALDIPDEVGSVAAAVYLPDGRISEMNRPSMNPFWHLGGFFATAFRGRSGFHVTDEDYQRTDVREVDASSFVGFFLRVSLIREGRIGLPRKELFIYADDIIYILEMRKTGVKHWFVPKMTFSHDCQTLVNQKDVYHPLWKAYYVIRNRLKMYQVASGALFPLVLLLKAPAFLIASRYYRSCERAAYRRLALRAISDGIFGDFSKSHREITAYGESMLSHTKHC